MTYKAATQIRVGGDEDKYDFELFERGDTVTKSKLGVDDEGWDALVASKSVMLEEDFDLAFPEVKRARNQAAGTPSNLEGVEGTTLQAPTPEPGPEEEEPEALNPADPPKVEKAGTAEGFDTKGATNKTKAENVKGPEGPVGDAGDKK
jgi:hypothetical protein